MEDIYTPESSSIVLTTEGTVQSTTSNALPVSPGLTHQQRVSHSGECHFQPMSTPTSSLCLTRCGEPAAGESLVRANSNAARERTRVRTLRRAFLELQRTLPAVPRDTKLSKLDVLVLATTYIAHLTSTLARSPAESESHGSNITTGLAEPDVCRDQVQGSREQAPPLLVLASSTRRDARSLGNRHYEMLLARRELSHSCGTVGASRGVKNSGFSALNSHGYLHPVKKWPMRTRLYAGIMASASGARKNT